MRLICLLLFATVSCAFPSKEAAAVDPAATESRFALLDDVRLLANGLLQLGQSLKEFVHKTKGQINDIFQKLNVFDTSFYQLAVVTNEIKEEEEELKKTTTFLKANNEEIRNLSLEINSKINSILQERSQLHSKVGALEGRLRDLSQHLHPTEQLTEISALKEVIDSQEKSITDLLKAVREQHDQLNYQKNKIKSLEDKLNFDMSQETAEQPADSNPEAHKTFEYLTNNSTSTSFDMNNLPMDCNELFSRGERNSGIYPIKPNQSEPFNVYCEITAEGASTVIQRRQDGSVDFDQSWENYKNGFGDLEREFWLGLEKIYSIARQSESILQIELEDWKEETRFLQYQFSLEGPASHYTIHLKQLSGNVPDPMANHTGMRFSTRDSDNDNDKDYNCAKSYTGGWWFNACGETNLNGKYIWVRPKGRTERQRGIYWRPGSGNSYSLKSTKISIRHVPDVSSFH
ncbi:angiopoietin-related protein 3 [Megalops cyprinoides]|uniref:angiopoietin-related protein 3 n=1 Tax=Megalops cyprinoides TaxID=118141 RepID=UPI0018642F96|nr:angiopoietin-related protein 3 [Megalops cyprinoides]